MTELEKLQKPKEMKYAACGCKTAERQLF